MPLVRVKIIDMSVMYVDY